MKYLLWKDYMMMRSMVWFLFIVYVVTSAMSFREPAGMSSVEAVMGTTLLLSAFAYDEQCDFMKYACITSVSRRQYVGEKYLLSLCYSVIAALPPLIIACISSLFNGWDRIINAAVASALVLVISQILGVWVIALCIRFGSQKGRIYLLLFYAAVILVVLLNVVAVRYRLFQEKAGTEEVVFQWWYLFPCVGAILASTILMLQRSFVWMKKKEF